MRVEQVRYFKALYNKMLIWSADNADMKKRMQDNIDRMHASHNTEMELLREFHRKELLRVEENMDNKFSLLMAEMKLVAAESKATRSEFRTAYSAVESKQNSAISRLDFMLASLFPGVPLSFDDAKKGEEDYLKTLPVEKKEAAIEKQKKTAEEQKKEKGKAVEGEGSKDMTLMVARTPQLGPVTADIISKLPVTLPLQHSVVPMSEKRKIVEAGMKEVEGKMDARVMNILKQYGGIPARRDTDAIPNDGDEPRSVEEFKTLESVGYFEGMSMAKAWDLYWEKGLKLCEEADRQQTTSSHSAGHSAGKKKTPIQYTPRGRGRSGGGRGFQPRPLPKNIEYVDPGKKGRIYWPGYDEVANREVARKNTDYVKRIEEENKRQDQLWEENQRRQERKRKDDAAKRAYEKKKAAEEEKKRKRPEDDRVEEDRRRQRRR